MSDYYLICIIDKNILVEKQNFKVVFKKTSKNGFFFQLFFSHFCFRKSLHPIY
jgi:hypothetical protein